MPTSAAESYPPEARTERSRSLPRTVTHTSILPAPARRAAPASRPRPQADLSRKYDLEASLLMAGLAFLAVVWRSPEFAALDGVQLVVNRFKIETAYYACNGAAGLAFMLMFIAWCINEAVLRWTAAIGEQAGSAARIERILVPALAFAWLGFSWPFSIAIQQLGLYPVLLLLLGLQLSLQLCPYWLERRPHIARASISRYTSSLLILPVLALSLSSSLPVHAEQTSFKPDITFTTNTASVAQTVATPPANTAGQAAPQPTPAPSFDDLRAKVVNANRHVGKTGDVRWLVVHHSGTAGGDGLQYTLGHNDWSNTPYHFVIKPNGAIQWLQDLDIPSYNAGFSSNDPQTEYGSIVNNHSIAVCLVGNFEETAPTSAQLQSLEALLRWLMARYRLSADRIIGHREAEGAHTLCPGKLDLDGLRVRLSKPRAS